MLNIQILDEEKIYVGLHLRSETENALDAHISNSGGLTRNNRSSIISFAIEEFLNRGKLDLSNTKKSAETGKLKPSNNIYISRRLNGRLDDFINNQHRVVCTITKSGVIDLAIEEFLKGQENEKI